MTAHSVCSISSCHEWATPRSSTSYDNLQALSCIVQSDPAEQGVEIEGDSASERNVFRIQRPVRPMSNSSASSVQEKLFQARILSELLRMDSASNRVVQPDTEKKKAALLELMHRLEAHDLDCLSNLRNEGRLTAAAEALCVGDVETSRIFIDAFSSLLRIYIVSKDWKEGRSLHRLAKECGLDSDPFLGTWFVRMYSNFECLPEAKKAFWRISRHTVFSYNSYISAYLRIGRLRHVMYIYRQMQRLEIPPNEFTLVSVLKSCCNEDELMDVHSHAINYGLETENFVGSTLIDMYVRYGRLEEALAVLHGMSTHNVVAWSTLISGYVQQKQPEVAFRLFMQMQQLGLQPNQFTYVALLKACSTLGAAEVGSLIHRQILEDGFEMHNMVGSALVDMYSRNGNLDDAHAMLNRMGRLDVVAWSALISGHAQHGHYQEALGVFWEGLNKGIVPDNVAFSTILRICPLIAAFEQGVMTHTHAVEGGLAGDLFVGSALVGLYAQCGSLEDACAVFEQLHYRSVWTWCAIISGCAQHNDFTLAVRYFERMCQGGLQPNSLALLALLAACNHEGRWKEGFYYLKFVQGHEGIVTSEHFYAMVDLLGRACRFDEAEDLLESLYFQSDADGWRSLLRTCYKQGFVGLGRRCFNRLSSLCAADSDYVMMSCIYAQAGDHAEAGKIEEMRRAADLHREIPVAYIEVGKQVNSFSSGDLVHPQKEEILSKLVAVGMGQYEANRSGHSDVYGDIAEALQTKVLCGHPERLAVAFGLISSSPSTILRISKTPWMCAACHSAIKSVSKAEPREIVVFVGNRIHRFHEGACCCKDKL